MIICTECDKGTLNILLHWAITHKRELGEIHRLQDIQANRREGRKWVQDAVS